MTLPTIAHVVRAYGGVTEPFIEQRILASAGAGQLWYERLDSISPISAKHIDTGPLVAGSWVDRVFHRVPRVGPPFARAYRAAEVGRHPDLIHAHYLTTGYLVGSVTRGPIVVSTYGFDVTVLARRALWRPAIRAVSHRASLVLAEGPHMRNHLVELGFRPQRLRVVPIAAHLQDISYRDPQPPSSSFRVVCCGRLVRKKGHDLAIRGFARALNRLPEGSTLDIIGGGRLESRLRDLARQLKVETRVNFLGALSRPAYLRHLSECDVLVAPSITAPNGDGEGGAPTTILDAQATGVIAVGSTHADIPFLIEDAKTGYLFPEGDAAALADTLLRAVGDGARWPGIAFSARRQVEQRHSDRAVSDLLDAVYREALE